MSDSEQVAQLTKMVNDLMATVNTLVAKLGSQTGQSTTASATTKPTAPPTLPKSSGGLGISPEFFQSIGYSAADAQQAYAQIFPGATGAMRGTGFQSPLFGLDTGSMGQGAFGSMGAGTLGLGSYLAGGPSPVGSYIDSIIGPDLSAQLLGAEGAIQSTMASIPGLGTVPQAGTNPLASILGGSATGGLSI